MAINGTGIHTHTLPYFFIAYHKTFYWQNTSSERVSRFHIL